MINPYREYIRLIKEGKLDPYDVDIDILIKEFKEKISILDNFHLYTLSAMFIEAVSRLIKLKTDIVYNRLFPEAENTTEKEEKKRYIKERIEEILKEYDLIEDEELQNLFSGYRRKTGRKAGTKIKNIERLSLEEFKEITQRQIKEEVLFKSIDYNKYAKEIAEKIKKGTFKIKTFQDFIGLMFAITFEEVVVKDIKQFL